MQKLTNDGLEQYNTCEEEILTSRFEPSDSTAKLLSKEENELRIHLNSSQFNTTKNKGVLVKIKAKLKKLRKDNKKNKHIQTQVNQLLKLVNDQLKTSRSISIPRVKRNGELFNSNLLYSNNTAGECENYQPNPDTFRKLDTDRGYESQGVKPSSLANMIPATYDQKYSTKSKRMSTVDENKLKLPLHLVHSNTHQMSLIQNSVANTNRSDKTKILFCGNQSNRTGEYQSSYNTADFTYEERCEKDDTIKRHGGNIQKLADIVAQNENSRVKPDKKTIEILNYYNRSMNSETTQENHKENKMLKEALYATIKLV